jgi:uncharacterized protein
MNPFVFDRPLPPDELVDRADELHALIGLALGGQSSRLAAPRRYGKTTLLRALVKHVEDEGFVGTLLDFSHVTNLADVVARIEQGYEEGLDRGRLRALWRTIRRRLTVQGHVGVPGDVAGVSLTVAAGDAGGLLARLHHLLEIPREVHERTGRQCLVVFDEFQDLLSVIDNVDGILRSHIQHHHGVSSYVFAGSEPSLMAELFGDRRRPLFGQARGVELGPLPALALAEWLEERLAGRGALAERIDELVAFSGGHPQRAMMLAHFLWEEDPDDPAAFERAREKAVREAREGLEQSWAGLSANERRVLGAIVNGDRQVTGRRALERTGLGKGSAAHATKRLIAEGVARVSLDGLPSVVDPLLAFWLTERP